MFHKSVVICRTNGRFKHFKNIQRWKRPAPHVRWLDSHVCFSHAKASTAAVPPEHYRKAVGTPSPGPEGSRPCSSAGSTLGSTDFASSSTSKRAHTGMGIVSGSSRLTGVWEAIGDSDATRREGRTISVDSRGRFIQNPKSARSAEDAQLEIRLRMEKMVALVLPRGFPESVHSPYAAYSAWQFSGMIASAAAGVMSTQALLYAMGLGDGSIPLAATLNWVIKDGLGQLGGVAFSSLVNTRFDSNPRLWRMIAAISLDLSMVLELLSPLVPGYFLLIASVANVGKNVSFLAASASRAAIHNMLSAKGNLADVTGKAGAQNIVACTIGTGMGIALSSLLGPDFGAIIPTCLLLSAFHLSATYTSVRRVGIPTFDSQRLELVVGAYIGSQTVPTPRDLAERERFFSHGILALLGLYASPNITVGSRLEEAVRDNGELESLCQACESLPFLLSVRGDHSAGTGEVHVLLLEGCGPREVLAGGYLAHVARNILLERGLQRPRLMKPSFPLLGAKASSPAPLGEVLPDVITEALRRGAVSPTSSTLSLGGRGGTAAEFISQAEDAGWNTSVVFLERRGAARLRLFHGDAPDS